MGTSKRTSKRTSKALQKVERFLGSSDPIGSEPERYSKPKRSAASLAAWSDEIAAFRERVGFDLTEPVGYSEFLLSVFGPDATEPDIQSQMQGLDRAVGHWGKRIDTVFDAWADGMAPKGLVCARGLNGLGFLPGDDVAKIVFDSRRSGGRRVRDEHISFYSMNVPRSVWGFAAYYVESGYPFLTDLWTRAAAAIDPDVVNYQFRDAEHAESGSPPLMFRLPEYPMPSGVKRAYYLSQCPVVIISHAAPKDLLSFGGDSESGETDEAEVYVRYCEPRCVKHLFVASTRKLGTPVSAKLRRYYALDEHIEVRGRKTSSWDDGPKLILHPDVKTQRGRLVRHLPDEWTWYEVPVR